jgi:predicted DNA repair protein MutK
MASGLLILLDDIATLLDDVALLTKVAAKKTAGVLGDDLALNAEQVTGVRPNRELPVVWAVAKGSFLNKAILVPAAILLSTFAPQTIVPLMIAGGTFLCYEGCEKLAHKFLHSAKEDKAEHEELVEAIADPSVDIVAHEKTKIRGAIRTDFILSAEIIVITLGTISSAPLVMGTVTPVPLMTKVGVLVTVAILMTVGVYGLVAGIVKLDDLGAKLLASEGSGARVASQRKMGSAILAGAPYLMKLLSIAGTAAMFLVGGGILSHGFAAIHHAIEGVTHSIPDIAGLGSILQGTAKVLLEGLVGIVAGAVVLAIVTAIKGLRSKPAVPTA